MVGISGVDLLLFGSGKGTGTIYFSTKPPNTLNKALTHNCIVTDCMLYIHATVLLYCFGLTCETTFSQSINALFATLT